jgi:hypothetical protein
MERPRTAVGLWVNPERSDPIRQNTVYILFHPVKWKPDETRRRKAGAWRDCGHRLGSPSCSAGRLNCDVKRRSSQDQGFSGGRGAERAEGRPSFPSSANHQLDLRGIGISGVEHPTRTSARSRLTGSRLDQPDISPDGVNSFGNRNDVIGGLQKTYKPALFMIAYAKLHTKPRCVYCTRLDSVLFLEGLGNGVEP